MERMRKCSLNTLKQNDRKMEIKRNSYSFQKVGLFNYNECQSKIDCISSHFGCVDLTIKSQVWWFGIP